MKSGGRLALPLGALLLCAALAGPLALRAPSTSAPTGEALAAARSEAEAQARVRLRGAGLSDRLLDEAGRGPRLEELAAGYPSSVGGDGRGGAGAGVGITLLLAALALGAAAVIGRRLDGDLNLLSRRVERAGDDEGLSTAGLSFVETARLGEALGIELRGGDSAVPRRMAPDNTRRQRSHLLASVSHDLRSPLNSILGFSELLLRGADGPLDELLRPPLFRIRVAGKRQLRLVNQILEIARWQAGRMALEPRKTLVAELLRDAVEEFQRAHELPPDVEVDREMEAGMAPVLVDGMRLAQALAELLGEALAALEQAAGRSGPALGRIKLQASERRQAGERELVLAVEVPVELRPEVRRSGSASFRVLAPGDLGLAVPLARALIELHAGTLTVEDGPPPRLVARLPMR